MLKKYTLLVLAVITTIGGFAVPIGGTISIWSNIEIGMKIMLTGLIVFLFTSLLYMFIDSFIKGEKK